MCVCSHRVRVSSMAALWLVSVVSVRQTADMCLSVVAVPAVDELRAADSCGSDLATDPGPGGSGFNRAIGGRTDEFLELQLDVQRLAAVLAAVLALLMLVMVTVICLTCPASTAEQSGDNGRRMKQLAAALAASQQQVAQLAAQLESARRAPEMARQPNEAMPTYAATRPVESQTLGSEAVEQSTPHDPLQSKGDQLKPSQAAAPNLTDCRPHAMPSIDVDEADDHNAWRRVVCQRKPATSCSEPGLRMNWVRVPYGPVLSPVVHFTSLGQKYKAFVPGGVQPGAVFLVRIPIVSNAGPEPKLVQAVYSAHGGPVVYGARGPKVLKPAYIIAAAERRVAQCRVDELKIPEAEYQAGNRGYRGTGYRTRADVREAILLIMRHDLDDDECITQFPSRYWCKKRRGGRSQRERVERESRSACKGAPCKRQQEHRPEPEPDEPGAGGIPIGWQRTSSLPDPFEDVHRQLLEPNDDSDVAPLPAPLQPAPPPPPHRYRTRYQERMQAGQHMAVRIKCCGCHCVHRVPADAKAGITVLRCPTCQTRQRLPVDAER